MKKFLYFGAALMIGACVYGFVDFKNNSRQKDFVKMYDKPDPVVQHIETPDIKTGDQNVMGENKKKDILPDTTTNKKQPSVHKHFNIRSFSRAPLRNIDTVHINH